MTTPINMKEMESNKNLRIPLSAHLIPCFRYFGTIWEMARISNEMGSKGNTNTPTRLAVTSKKLDQLNSLLHAREIFGKTTKNSESKMTLFITLV